MWMFESSGPAVYIHRPCRTHFGSEPVMISRTPPYFPEHRHTGDRGGMAVHRYESGGIRRADHGPVERILTLAVDNIEHLESTTINGQTMSDLPQHGASLDTGMPRLTGVSQTILRSAAGTLPPIIIQLQRLERAYSAAGPFPKWASEQQ